ncbi:MAG: chemotaxis protein CheB [Candidatus Binatia bacterium]
MPKRDIVVVGGSSGALPALQEIAAGLPPGLPATVLIVVHSGPDTPGLLPELLTRAGPLPASYAENGEQFRPGRIYCAPPDRHLLLSDGRLSVTSGPRENGFRPAVDPLFRTAALQHGPRVVGIVLSGGLDDGTRGLDVVKRAGGVAIAQDPDEAAVPHMPLSAIRFVHVDFVLSAVQMPSVIVRLAHERIGPGKKIGSQSGRADRARAGTKLLEEGIAPGAPSPFTCPECGGALWEQSAPAVTSYQCHVGHAFTAEALNTSIDNGIEMAMWTALRVLQESIALQRNMAQRTRKSGLTALADAYEARAEHGSERAAIIRTVLTGTANAGQSRNARRQPAPDKRRRRKRKSDERTPSVDKH